MNALPYSSLGPYAVEEFLGSGGFATVFRCVDERLQAEVAIKVLADNHATDPEIRSRFLREGRTLRQIDNPFLIRVHDVGETDRGQPYLVLEYADRGDLLNRVIDLRAKGWKPTSADVACLAEAMLGAAGALHAQRLVHRDIKPDNVLIRSTTTEVTRANVSVLMADERMMVSDLGLVKDLAENSGLTVAGGSREFGAPEQFTGSPVTARADLFAAARVLEWITAEGVADDNGWHQRLVEALAPALSPDPAMRPASATELSTAVTSALRNSSLDAASPRSEVPTQIQTKPEAVAAQDHRAVAMARPRRNRTALAALLGALLLAALGSVVVSRVTNDDVPTAIADNRGAVEIELDDGQTARVEGPLSVSIDTKETFEATAPSSANFTWVLPDGSEISNVAAISVLGEAAGTSVIRLRVDMGDDTAELDYKFNVE